MKTSVLLATVAAIALPGAALAQMTPTMSSTVTLGFTSGSLDVLGTDVADLNTTSIDVDSDIGFGPNINVGLDFGIAMTEIDVFGIGLQSDLMSFAFEPSYHFANGAYVGAYYRMGDLDISIDFLGGLTLGVDTRQSGLFAGYENGPLWVEAFFGTSDTAPGIGGGIDITDMGLAASYSVMPNLDVFGSYTRTDIDTGGFFDIDLTLMAIGADYDFGNGLSVYGSVGRFDIDNPLAVSLDATQFNLGAAYDLSGGGFPAIVSLEMSRTNFDVAGFDADINSFGLGLTIPLGNNASTTALNSSTQIARGSYRSAIAGGLASLR